MPCADCLEQQKILIRLTSALHEREQQNQEINNKFHKYKLQTKAKFAQLRHQILENVGTEDINNTNRLSNLLLRLDETDGQLSQFKEQIDDLKCQLDKKDREKIDYENQIKLLQQKLDRKKSSSGSGGGGKYDSLSSDDEKFTTSAGDSKDQIQQMYAQLVYKDSKIVELSRQIDDQDRKIMEWQEACGERDEVNKAKTKAIQILQEQLSRFVNKKRKDQATETDNADFEVNANVAKVSANASPTPGRAVAFYRDQAKKDEEESSFTTDLTANDLEADFFPLAKDGKNIDKLNNRLSGLLQQVESMQKKVIKNELAEFEKNFQDVPAANQSMFAKKTKKEKKVTFDFSEQQRLAEISELQEKLQKTDLACNDLREENDELRLTIADLEQRLDERIAKNEYFEKLCSDLEIQLDSSERNAQDLTKQLDDMKKENKASALKSKAQQTTKIKELEEQIIVTQTEVEEKRILIVELENSSRNLTEEVEKYKEETEKLKISVRSLTEELQQSYVNAGKLQEHNKKLETDFLAKLESQKILENLLKKSSDDADDLTKQLEELRRDQKNTLFKTKAHASVRAKELEEELENLKLALKQSQERESLLRNNVDILERELETVSADRDLFLKQKDDIRRDLDELKEVIETSQEVIDFLEGDLELSYTEMEELRRQLEADHDNQKSEITRENMESRLKFKAYLAKMKALQKDNERLDEELNQLTEKCEQLKNEKFLLALDLEESRGAIEVEQEKRCKLEETYGEICNVYERSSKDARIWLDKIAELQNVVQQKTQESSQYFDQLHQKDELLDGVRQQLDNCSHELETYKKQNKSLLLEKQEIETELQKLWRHESSLKKHLADLESQFDDINKEKSTLSVQSREHVEQVQQITLKFQSLIQEKDQLYNENLQLKDQLTVLQSSSSSQTSSLVDQVSLFKNSAKEHKEENHRLRADLEKLQLKCHDLLDDKKFLDSKLQSLSKQLEEESQIHTEQKRQLEFAAEAKLNEYKRLEEVLSKSSAKSDAVAVAAQLETERNNLVKLLDVEQSARASLEHELQEQQKVSSDFIGQLNLLADKLRTTENRVEEILSEKNDLEQQLTVLIVEKAQLDNVYSNLTQEYVSMKEQQDRLVDQCKQNDQQKFDIDSLQKELNNFKQQALSAEADSQKKHEYIIQEHCNTIDNLRSFIEELQSNSVLKDSKIAVLSSELSELQTKIEALQRNHEVANIIDSANESSELYEEVKELNLTCNLLKDEKQKLSEERQTLCNEIINLNSRLTDANNHIDAQKIIVDGMSQSIDEVIRENERLKEQIAQPPNDVSEILAQKQSLEAAYQQMSDYYSQLQTAYTDLYSKVKDVNPEQQLQKQPTNFGDTIESDELEFFEVAVVTNIAQQVPIQDTTSAPAETDRTTAEIIQELLQKIAVLQDKNKSLAEQLETVDNSKLQTSDFSLETGHQIEAEGYVNNNAAKLDLEHKLQEMGEQIIALKNEKQFLESKIGELETEKSNSEEASHEYTQKLEEKIEMLANEKVSLLEMMAAGEDAIEQLKNEFESKINAFGEHKHHLLTRLTETSDSGEEADDVHLSDVEIDQSHHFDLKSEDTSVYTIDHQIESLQRELSRISDEKEQLELKLIGAENFFADEKQKYQREILLLKEEVRGLSQHISILVAEVDDQKMKLRRSEERTNTSDASFEKLQLRYEDLFGTNALLNEEIVGLKKICYNFDSEKSKISDNFAAKISEETKLKEKMLDLEKESLDKSEKIAALENILQHFNATKKEQETDQLSENEKLQQSLEEIILEKNRVQDKLRRLLAENDSLANEKENLEQAMNSLQTESMKKIEAESKSLSLALQDAKVNLTTAEENLHSATKENEVLCQELINSRMTVDVLNEQIKTYAQQMSKADEELVMAKSETETLQQKLSEMDELFSNAAMSNEELSQYWSNKCAEIENQLKLVSAELETLKLKQSANLENVERVQVEMQQKTSENVFDDLKRQLLSLEAERAGLCDQLEKEKLFSNNLKNLEFLMEDLKNKIALLEAENAELSAELETERSIKINQKNLENSSADLTNRLVALEAEKADLNTKLENGMADNVNLQSSINSLMSAKTVVEQSVMNLQVELEEQRRLASSLEKEVKSYQLQLEENRIQLEDEKQLKSSLESTISTKSLSDQLLKEAHEKIDNIKSENQLLEREVSNLKDKLQQKEKILGEITSDKLAVESHNLQIVHQYETLNATYAQLYDAYNLVVSTKTSTDEELQRLQKQLLDLMEKCHIIETEHAGCDKEVKQANEENSLLLQKLAEAGNNETALKEKSVELDSLQKDFDDLLIKYTEQLSNVDSTAKEFQMKNDYLQRKVADSEQEVQFWQQSSKKFEESSKTLQVNLADVESKLKLLSEKEKELAVLAADAEQKQEEYESLKTDFDDLLIKYTEQESVCNDVQALLDESEGKNKILSEKVEQLENDSWILKENATKLENSGTNLTDHVSDLQNQLLLATETNKMLELACDDLENVKAKNKSLEQNVEKMKLMLENSYQSCAQLENELVAAKSLQDSLEVKLNGSKVTEEEFLQKNQQLTDELMASKNLQLTLEANLNTAEKCKEQLQQQVTTLMEEVKTNNAEKTAELGVLQLQVEKLNDALRISEEQLKHKEEGLIDSEENSRLQQEVKELHEKNNQMANGTAEIGREFDKVKREYQTNMKQLNEEVDKLKRENKKLSHLLHESDASCSRFKQKAFDLNIELSEKNVINEKMQQSVDELTLMKDHVNKLEKDKEYMRSQLNEAQTAFGQIQLECQMLREEIENINKERLANSKLTEELKKASQEAQSLVGTLEHERSAHSNVQHEIGELREQLSHMERQLESYRLKLAERDVLKEKLKENDSQLDRLVSDKKDLTNRDRKNRAEISKLMQELVAQKNENANLSRKLEESIQESLKYQDKCKLFETNLEEKHLENSTSSNINEHVQKLSLKNEFVKDTSNPKSDFQSKRTETITATTSHSSDHVDLPSSSGHTRQRFATPPATITDSHVEGGLVRDRSNNSNAELPVQSQKSLLTRRRPYQLH